MLGCGGLECRLHEVLWTWPSRRLPAQHESGSGIAEPQIRPRPTCRVGMLRSELICQHKDQSELDVRKWRAKASTFGITSRCILSNTKNATRPARLPIRDLMASSSSESFLLVFIAGRFVERENLDLRIVSFSQALAWLNNRVSDPVRSAVLNSRPDTVLRSKRPTGLRCRSAHGTRPWENVVSLEKIADELDIGMRQLRRLFVQHVGISPISYLQTQRLLMAKRLLAETKMSLRKSRWQVIRQYPKVQRIVQSKVPNVPIGLSKAPIQFERSRSTLR